MTDFQLQLEKAGTANQIHEKFRADIISKVSVLENAEMSKADKYDFLVSWLKEKC